MKPWLWCVTMVLALFVTLPAHAAVRAWLDTTEVAPGDTVQLTLEHDGQTNDQPDLAPLRQDFDILASRRSSSIRIANGNTSSLTEVILTLSPKRGGTLRVPPITWGGESSPFLALSVTSNAGGSSGASGKSTQVAGSKVFIETQVDPKQPYVQGAVRVTVRLYTAETLYHANLDLPASGDALVQSIGDDEYSNTVRNGLQYRVVTHRYVVFPQHSGKISLPGAVLDAEVAAGQSRSSFFGTDPFADVFGNSPFGGILTATRPLRLHGDAIELDVRARPASAASNYWLPAQNVTLTSQWHPDELRAHVGDPLTVDLHLRVEGLTAEQLPEMSSLLVLPQGLKAYPDKARLANTTQGGTVVGTRDQSIALIADQPGNYTLPALQLQWWDTAADSAREITLPARKLTILPAAAGSAAKPAGATHPAETATAHESNAAASPEHSSRSAMAGNAHGDVPWRWIGIGAALLWLATLGAWLWSHKRKSSSAGQPPRPAAQKSSRLQPATARAAFHDACRNNDAGAARRHLLAWAGTMWPDSPPAGLNALAKLVAKPDVTELLRDLDRACYAGGDWRGEPLAGVLSELPARKQGAADRDRGLAPLYH